MAQVITPETFHFLRQLKKHNNKEWFNENKKWYNLSIENFKEFSQKILEELQKSNPDFQLKVLRIYRDLRFSKDKTPYKTNFGAAFFTPNNQSGFYIHLQPSNSFLASGIHRPDQNTLIKAREKIDQQSEKFLKIIQNEDFKKLFSIEGEKLLRPPKPYSRNHPLIKYLKFKDYTIIHKLTDKQVQEIKFPEYANKLFLKMQPFLEFFKI